MQQFLTVSERPNTLGFQEFANFNQDGSDLGGEDPILPLTIWFEFAGDTQELWPDWTDYSIR